MAFWPRLFNYSSACTHRDSAGRPKSKAVIISEQTATINRLRKTIGDLHVGQSVLEERLESSQKEAEQLRHENSQLQSLFAGASRRLEACSHRWTLHATLLEMLMSMSPDTLRAIRTQGIMISPKPPAAADPAPASVASPDPPTTEAIPEEIPSHDNPYSDL